MKRTNVSIIIPCYRSENTIEVVVEEVRKVFSLHKEEDYELILVNDSSPDHVWQKIRELAGKYEQVTGIDLARNFGQHSAVMAGLSVCRGDIAVMVDDDGQIPVDEIYKLIDGIHNGYDVVYGVYGRHHKESLRSIGTWLNKKMAESLLNKPKELKTTSFFALKRFMIEEILKYENAFPYLAGLVLRTTSNIGMVEVDHRERIAGGSGYTISKLFGLWLNGFTAFSVKPLRLASYAGIFSATIGFLYGFFIFVRRLLNPDIVLGYSSTMAAILFIGGVIMLMLGIIGEYIGRIYISMNKSPQYVIRAVVGKGDYDESSVDQ